MKKYYLIYGWDLKNKKIIKPTIKEVDIAEVETLVLPEIPDIKLAKCYCSVEKKEVEDMLNRSWELFEKVNLWYTAKIIINMKFLCVKQEKRINAEWLTMKWPEDDLPF